MRHLVQFTHGAHGGFAHIQPRLHQIAQFQQAACPGGRCLRQGRSTKRPMARSLRMRWAVLGCRPVRSLISFNETGSGCAASISSSEKLRSSTWMVGFWAVLCWSWRASVSWKHDLILHRGTNDCIPEAGVLVWVGCCTCWLPGWPSHLRSAWRHVQRARRRVLLRHSSRGACVRRAPASGPAAGAALAADSTGRQAACVPPTSGLVINTCRPGFCGAWANTTSQRAALAPRRRCCGVSLAREGFARCDEAEFEALVRSASTGHFGAGHTGAGTGLDGALRCGMQFHHRCAGPRLRRRGPVQAGLARCFARCRATSTSDVRRPHATTGFHAPGHVAGGVARLQEALAMIDRGVASPTGTLALRGRPPVTA